MSMLEFFAPFMLTLSMFWSFTLYTSAMLVFKFLIPSASSAPAMFISRSFAISLLFVTFALIVFLFKFFALSAFNIS